MRGRLEREIRLLPHVLACQVTPDDIVVLVEPAADPAEVRASAEAIVAAAGATAAIRVLATGGPQRPKGAPAIPRSVPAKLAVAAMALSGVVALGVGVRIAPSVDDPDPSQSGAAPWLFPSVWDDRPIWTRGGIDGPVDMGGIVAIPDLPPFVPAGRDDLDTGGTDQGVLPGSNGRPGEPAAPSGPPDVGVTDDAGTCDVRPAGRSHVLHLQASAAGTEIRATLLSPRGLAIGRDQRVVFDGRPNRETSRWLSAILQKAGCDLEPGSSLITALGDGLRVVVVVPAETDDGSQRGGERKTRPTDEARGDMRGRPKGRRRSIRAPEA